MHSRHYILGSVYSCTNIGMYHNVISMQANFDQEGRHSALLSWDLSLQADIGSRSAHIVGMSAASIYRHQSIWLVPFAPIVNPNSPVAHAEYGPVYNEESYFGPHHFAFVVTGDQKILGTRSATIRNNQERIIVFPAPYTLSNIGIGPFHQPYLRVLEWLMGQGFEPVW